MLVMGPMLYACHVTSYIYSMPVMWPVIYAILYACHGTNAVCLSCDQLYMQYCMPVMWPVIYYTLGSLLQFNLYWHVLARGWVIMPQMTNERSGSKRVLTWFEDNNGNHILWTSVGDTLPYSYHLNFLFSKVPVDMKSPHQVGRRGKEVGRREVRGWACWDFHEIVIHQKTYPTTYIIKLYYVGIHTCNIYTYCIYMSLLCGCYGYSCFVNNPHQYGIGTKECNLEERMQYLKGKNTISQLGNAFSNQMSTAEGAHSCTLC